MRDAYFADGRTAVQRAVLIEGDGAAMGSPTVYDVDVFYYLLQELDTVTGLISKNGTLVEAYTYDAYGNVSPWGYRILDFNRDGDVDYNDEDEWWEAYQSAPASDPMADANTDGVVDIFDLYFLPGVFTGDGVPPITLRTSAIGNAYMFTGRNLHFFETLYDGTPEGVDANKRVQYNRARHYDPVHGRWLRREAAEHFDRLNVCEYVRRAPAGQGGQALSDPAGLPDGSERTAPSMFAGPIVRFPVPADLLLSYNGCCEPAGK